MFEKPKPKLFGLSPATYGVASVLQEHGPVPRQWTTAFLAMSVSLFLCWLNSSSKALEQKFYMP